MGWRRCLRVAHEVAAFCVHVGGQLPVVRFDLRGRDFGHLVEEDPLDRRVPGVVVSNRALDGAERRLPYLVNTYPITRWPCSSQNRIGSAYIFASRLTGPLLGLRITVEPAGAASHIVCQGSGEPSGAKYAGTSSRGPPSARATPSDAVRTHSPITARVTPQASLTGSRRSLRLGVARIG